MLRQQDIFQIEITYFDFKIQVSLASYNPRLKVAQGFFQSLAQHHYYEMDSSFLYVFL